MLFVALASLPTPLAAAQPAPAALKISEVMAAPQGNLTEAEGEWLELIVTAGGALDGIAITDFDGAVDFVFPAASVEKGEWVIVANGATAPAGLDASARLFKAGKTWWTWDNAGDDISVLSAEGVPEDRLEYGEGPAVDPPGGQSTVPALEAPALPAGASFGRVGNASLALVPTPGSPNVALANASGHGLQLAAVLLQGDTAAPVVCPSTPGLGSAYLWSVDLGKSRIRFGEPSPGGLPCVFGGAFGSEAEGRAVSEALGLSVEADPGARAVAYTPGSRVALVDPWGEVAFERPLPAEQETPVRPAVLLVPSECAGGWQALALEPQPAVGTPRPTRGFEVVPAGGALRSALASLIQNATVSLDVNVYLMNSDFLEARLRDAAARGVQVRLLLEGAPVGGQKGSSPLDAASLQAFNDSGVWTRTFRAGAASAARDHAKYLVADLRAVAVLTENLVGAALSEEDPNIGYGAFCACAALARDLGAVFEWDFERGEARSSAPRWTAVEPGAPVEGGEADGTAALLLSPTPSPALWTALVAGARSSVRVEALSADLETLGPSSPLGGALLAAAKRGVRVRVLFSGDYDGLEGSETLGTARALAAAAGEISETLEVRAASRGPGSNATLHAKVLVVDEARFILGSHNLVRAAFASNREVSLLVEQAAAAAALAAWIDGHFARALAVAAVGVTLQGDAGVGVPGETRGLPASLPLAFLGFLAAGSTALGWGLLRSPGGLWRAWTSKAPARRKGAGQGPVPPPEGHSRGLLGTLEAKDEASDAMEAPLALRVAPPAEAPTPPPSVRLRPPTAFDLFGRP